MATLTPTSGLFTSESRTKNKENLSTRLVYAMTTLGVTQSELARRVGIKPQAIQYLCTSDASRSKFAFDIADALEINIEWLITGQGRMKEKDISENISKIPIIGLENICTWLQKNDNSIIISDHISTKKNNLSERCYAIKMNDSSMLPRFEIGTILIIDPELVPQENDFVIVDTKFSQTPIVRHLIKKNERFILKPFNIDLYKEIEMDKSHKFLGVLRQTFYDFSKR